MEFNGSLESFSGQTSCGVKQMKLFRFDGYYYI